MTGGCHGASRSSQARTNKDFRIGGPKNYSFYPKMSQFQIDYPIRISGLGVPKTTHFRVYHSPQRTLRAPALLHNWIRKYFFFESSCAAECCLV